MKAASAAYLLPHEREPGGKRGRKLANPLPIPEQLADVQAMHGPEQVLRLALALAYQVVAQLVVFPQLVQPLHIAEVFRLMPPPGRQPQRLALRFGQKGQPPVHVQQRRGQGAVQGANTPRPQPSGTAQPEHAGLPLLRLVFGAAKGKPRVVQQEAEAPAAAQEPLLQPGRYLSPIK